MLTVFDHLTRRCAALDTRLTAGAHADDGAARDADTAGLDAPVLFALADARRDRAARVALGLPSLELAWRLAGVCATAAEAAVDEGATHEWRRQAASVLRVLDGEASAGAILQGRTRLDPARRAALGLDDDAQALEAWQDLMRARPAADADPRERVLAADLAELATERVSLAGGAIDSARLANLVRAQLADASGDQNAPPRDLDAHAEPMLTAAADGAVDWDELAVTPTEPLGLAVRPVAGHRQSASESDRLGGVRVHGTAKIPSAPADSAGEPVATALRELRESLDAGGGATGALDRIGGAAERAVLELVLAHTNNNRVQTARLLGIERSRLYRLLKRHKL